jgi:ribonuclease M5
MLRIREAIVVEGRYDKNTLSQLVDTVIIDTAGFGIFREEGRLDLLRRLARRRGLIILTDPDGAGLVIRNYLKGTIPPEQLKHAYIPDVYGKERRKRHRGREGKLGVEGMPPAVLEQALRRAGATILEEKSPQETCRPGITKADLYRLGLSGAPDSRQRRRALLTKLDLPAHLSSNALLDVLNCLYSREEFYTQAGAESLAQSADLRYDNTTGGKN